MIINLYRRFLQSTNNTEAGGQYGDRRDHLYFDHTYTLFIGVIIAGGKSHDHTNSVAKRRASEIDDKTSAGDDENNG